MRWLALLLLVPLLTSCAALPAEERAFAVALMVDKKDGIWRVHARIPTYKAEGGYLTVEGKGASPDAALAAMDAAAPMHIHLSQLRLLVLDAALGRDISVVLNLLANRADMRAQCAVAATDVPAGSVMEALQAATGARLSKGLDVLVDTRMVQGAGLSADLSGIIRMGERQSPVLMSLTVSDGTVDLSGGWALGTSGLIQLTAEETAMLALLRGDAEETVLHLQGRTAQVRDASAKVALAEDLQEVSITLSVTAVNASLMPEEIEIALCSELLRLLARLYSAGCDVLGLGRQVICGINDMEQWYTLNWPAQMRDLRWKVSVGVSGAA